MVSGRDDDARYAAKLLADRGVKRTPMAVDHTETKIAARMVRDGIAEATVVINHQTCRGRPPFGYGCGDLLPVILPAGSRLTVWDYDEHGHPRGISYLGGASRQ
ncbi:SCP1.201-like deaminase [Streptoalloteichus hindustanus]|uniref:SCP1.201-like deaminase n=2 Tax=Streptoalloteichus hindustanus TaxID=2017 RepID=A0A1M5I417_STRHI|nr:SCP1.201-like deaminase [Streptoalloteichus hindustanus]